MGGHPLFCVTARTMTGCLCCHFVCMLCGGFLFSPSSRRGKVTYFLHLPQHRAGAWIGEKSSAEHTDPSTLRA